MSLCPKEGTSRLSPQVLLRHRLMKILIILLGSLGAEYSIASKDPLNLDSITRIENQQYLTPKEINGKWGYVDESGRFVIPPKYFAALPFREGLALVVTKKAWTPLGTEAGEFRLATITYIDQQGREICPPLSVRSAKSFSDGLALVVPDNMLRLTGGCAKAGYLNKKGKWAIAPTFDRGEDFSEGMAAVSLHGNCGVGGKWGYVDKDGAVVIPFRFTWASPFREGRACVKLDTVREAVIDRFGNVLNGVKCK